MKKLIPLFLLFYINVYLCQQEQINFLNFGIITIKEDLFLDQSTWELEVKIKDSIYLFEKKSSFNKNFIFYNLNEHLNDNILLNNLDILTIKKDGKTIYKEQNKIDFFPRPNLFLTNTDKVNNNEIKGKVIDSYVVKNGKDFFYIVRTNYNNNFNYWYILKNEKIINIHSEKHEKQPYYTSKILITDLDKNQEPEFNLFHKTERKLKMIHLNMKEKIIAFLKDEKITLPLVTNNLDYIIYKGLFYYNLKKISE